MAFEEIRWAVLNLWFHMAKLPYDAKRPSDVIERKLRPHLIFPALVSSSGTPPISSRDSTN